MGIILKVSLTTIIGQDKMVIRVQNAKRGNLHIQRRDKEVCLSNNAEKSQLDSTSNMSSTHKEESS